MPFVSVVRFLFFSTFFLASSFSCFSYFLSFLFSFVLSFFFSFFVVLVFSVFFSFFFVPSLSLPVFLALVILFILVLGPGSGGAAVGLGGGLSLRSIPQPGMQWCRQPSHSTLGGGKQAASAAVNSDTCNLPSNSMHSHLRCKEVESRQTKRRLQPRQPHKAPLPRPLPRPLPASAIPVFPSVALAQ